ncbi:hypothetical protein EVAR_33514_1 [Eumeta japonica]|uniref:Uncharacterized protein n=1 Tax=Eumeta variegata TaxID=151549 RepID=A0A4C1VII5_EUMVA|nr:hypothetical protein EVAR_33514_1 [Eumeta japonica]
MVQASFRVVPKKWERNPWNTVSKMGGGHQNDCWPEMETSNSGQTAVETITQFNKKNWPGIEDKKKSMKFAVPRIWREPISHINDGYFCVVNPRERRAGKNAKKIQYPDLPSTTAPVHFPVPSRSNTKEQLPPSQVSGARRAGPRNQPPQLRSRRLLITPTYCDARVPIFLCDSLFMRRVSVGDAPPHRPGRRYLPVARRGRGVTVLSLYRSRETTLIKSTTLNDRPLIVVDAYTNYPRVEGPGAGQIRKYIPAPGRARAPCSQGAGRLQHKPRVVSHVIK